ncbi:MAG TPA: flavoprotein, partial [Rubrobacter sp.]|nr:flavoprotein [Rubrobacter sp.]
MDSEAQPVDRLLVGVSRSIAILSLPSYLASLKATLAREVKVIMTPNAAELLPPSTVALLCDGVFLDWSPTLEKRPGHMELARWSEMFVVLPASANVLGQAANGLATNLLTTTILASPRPVILFPNLTDVMWSKEAV